MKQKPKSWIRIFLFISILVGFLSRFYLAFSTPIWHDEAYSIWASTTPLLRIISGITDPVHPPGYYIFLNFWSFPTTHLLWMRMSTLLFFIANALILYQIGKKIRTPFYGFILIFMYVFSGYFIIFDWQVRMYTFIDTCILFSLLFLMEKNIYYLESLISSACILTMRFFGTFFRFSLSMHSFFG